jgi:hypothetical protein
VKRSQRIAIGLGLLTCGVVCLAPPIRIVELNSQNTYTYYEAGYYLLWNTPYRPDLKSWTDIDGTRFLVGLGAAVFATAAIGTLLGKNSN